MPGSQLILFCVIRRCADGRRGYGGEVRHIPKSLSVVLLRSHLETKMCKTENSLRQNVHFVTRS